MSEIMETKQMEEMAVENSSETGENIIVRVAGLPMVNSAIGQVSSMYTKTKEWNGLVKYTLETAEKSVATIAGTAMPVVNKLEKPINLANYYACTTMDKLEEACPIINQPTDKIVSSVVDGTKTAWDNTKKAGSDKINYMMQNRVVQAFTGTMDATLSLSEKVVDSYLPPEPTENEEYEKEKATEDAANSEKEIIPDAEEVGGESAVARVVNLSGKVRHRVYARAMSKLRNAQKRSRETLDNLKFTVNLIDYAKENIDSTNQKVKDQVTSAQDKLWSTWNDWTTEDGEQSSIADEQEQEQKTLAVARDLAKRLKIACGKVTSASLKILPDSMMTQVTKAKNFTDELYDSFKNAKVFNDLPSSLLTQAKDGLNQVSDMMMSVTEYAVNSRALQWLVPSKVKQALTSGGYDVILESIPPNPDDALDSDDEDDEDDDEDDDDDEIDIDDEFHTNEVVMSQ
ncbi:perilipin-2-like [Saccoglossus kowalevskii]